MTETVPALVALRQSVATPQTIAVRQAMADAIITVAIKAREWPTLHAAIDIKIADQRAFLAEWDNLIREGRPETRSRSERVFAKDLAERAGVSVPQIARWRQWLADAAAYHAKLVLAACRKAGIAPDTHHLALGTGDNEWFTPPDVIALARAVLGDIDLDPASHPIPQEWIRAARYFCATDDGLQQAWHGRLWINPPYSRDLIGRFTDKLLTELAAGNIISTLWLCHAYTDTAWFQKLAAAATAICFTRSRIKFLDMNGVPCNPVQGQAVLYFDAADRHVRFAARFQDLGFVMRPI